VREKSKPSEEKLGWSTKGRRVCSKMRRGSLLASPRSWRCGCFLREAKSDIDRDGRKHAASAVVSRLLFLALIFRKPTLSDSGPDLESDGEPFGGRAGYVHGDDLGMER
jgi:hypothetical protein